MGNLKEHVESEYNLQLIKDLEKDNAMLRNQLNKIYTIITVGIFVSIFVVVDLMFLFI
jgi:acetolactate synthase regulatory subunit